MVPKTKRIVVAEDESIIRLDLCHMLAGLGYLIVGEAADGQTAVELVRQTRPDVVLIDIKMPVMDGIEAARQINAEALAPVVLLTAYSQRDLIEQATTAGVINYLVKPFQDTDLHAAIEVALSRALATRTLEAENGQLKEQLEVRKVVEQAKGVLMDRQGLKEAAAFRRIQKLAMDSRKSMKEVAEAILLTHQV